MPGLPGAGLLSPPTLFPIGIIYLESSCLDSSNHARLPIGNQTPLVSSPKPTEAMSIPDRESIGAFVRQRRTAANLTQRQLAELVGTGVRLISDLENDKATLRMDAVNRVLAAFGRQLGPVERSPEEST